MPRLSRRSGIPGICTDTLNIVAALVAFALGLLLLSSAVSVGLFYLVYHILMHL